MPRYYIGESKMPAGRRRYKRKKRTGRDAGLHGRKRLWLRLL